MQWTKLIILSFFYYGCCSSERKMKTLLLLLLSVVAVTLVHCQSGSGGLYVAMPICMCMYYVYLNNLLWFNMVPYIFVSSSEESDFDPSCKTCSDGETRVSSILSCKPMSPFTPNENENEREIFEICNC